MPILLEPNQQFPIHLDSDASIPIDSRPVFLVRGVSLRDSGELDRAIQESVKQDTTDGLVGATCSLLAKYVMGWRNMGSMVHGVNDLAEFLTFGEARELLYKVLGNQHLKADEKKD